MRFKISLHPLVILFVLLAAVYWQFFVLGKIPVPTDALAGGYFPWLDYKWGYTVGVPVKNALLSDGFSQFFVWKYFLVDQIRLGILPLWNPLSFSGTPFLPAYHTTVFLPFNLILLLPKYWGWGIFVFMQTFLAAAGMYFLLKFYVKENTSRLVGGLVFSLSGLMATWVEYGTGTYAAAMLPWIFYSLKSYLKSLKFRYLFLLTICFSCLYLSGHAQLTLYSSFLFLLFLFYEYIKDKSKKTIHYLWPIIFLVISIGLASVQLLPSFGIVNSTIRGDEKYSTQFDYGLNKPYELIRFIAPDIFGNPGTNNQWDPISYHEQSGYFGVISLVLILPFIYSRFRRGDLNFWGVVFLASIFLAMTNPLTYWFYSLPLPLLTYSSASRIFFITIFCAGILAAVGFENFINEEKYKFFVKRVTILFAAVLMGITLGILIASYFIQGLTFDKEIILLKEHIMISLKNMVFPSFLLFLVFVLSLFSGKKRLVSYFLLLLIFFELGRFFLKYNPFVPVSTVFPKTPVIDFLQKQPGFFRIARADHEVFPPNSWMSYNLASIEGYDPMALDIYGRYMNRVNKFPYENGVGRYMELVNYPSKFLDSLNVKFLLAVKRDEHGVIPGDFLNYRLRKLDYKKVFEDKTTVVLENPHASDRAYFVGSVIKVDNKSDMVRLLDDQKFDPTKVAVITEGSSGNFSAVGDAKITGFSPNTITLTTNTKDRQFLVLSEVYDSGWSLFENGKPAKLLMVNGGLRGFYILPGINNYELNYWPKFLSLGIGIASISIGFYMGFMVISLKKRWW